MSVAASGFLFLCCILTAFQCEAKDFRIAFVLGGQLWDFGWTFTNNIARIKVMETLLQKYPDLNITHEYAFIQSTFTEECSPQIEAWCQSGVNVLISIDVGTQWCFARLAKAYPNITFVNGVGTIAGPLNYANAWVRFYQPNYLAGYTAGLVTKSKKVCVSTMVPIPAALLDVTGFSLGVHAADPTVEIHIFGTGQVQYQLLEVWIVNQSHALGCDVVWVQSVAIDGIQQAQQLGLMTFGYISDARLTVGDNVITSVMVDMTPAYLRAIEAVLNNTFRNETQKADWWMGWSWGAMSLGDFSFLVPKDVQAKVMAQVPTLDRTFCGRVCMQTRCICNNSSCCLSDAQLTSLDSYPDFVNHHGVVQLPGRACKAGQMATWHLNTFTMQCTDCPAGTYAHNLNEISECRTCPATTYSLAGASNCTACPAGMYSNQPGQGRCVPCPVGSIAADPASLRCSACPSGVSNTDGTQCVAESLVWVGGVVGGVGGGLLVVGLLLLWLTRRYGKRNNRAAPKDASQPFCILFTDIQGSTSLWATIPDVMAGALDAHHALIRKLIAKHRCYEVKTIGDSFMCATKHPDEALRFALVLQEELVQHNWGTDRIDEAYSEMIVRESWVPGCWKGLRVRVGIHYGRGNIKLDPVSHSYDYYGTVVNTAARIESVCHGGQIGVSEAVFVALGGHFPGAVWADLGLQPLRGLAQPIHLYQVLPEGALSQRQFPLLRINREDEKEDVLMEEVEILTTTRTQPGSRVQVHPSTCSSSKGQPWRSGAWAENHALVAKGDISAEDLRRHYHILQVGLSTLLTPLGRAPKQHVVRELCTHLHVPNHGADGPDLVNTLHGLITRVLPATVVQSLDGPPTPNAAARRRMTALSHGDCEA